MSPTCGCPWSLEEGTGSLGFGELLVVVSHWISVLGAKLQSSIKATSSLNQPQTISSVQGIQHPLLATMGTVLKLNLKRSCVSCSGTHNQVDGINLRVNARGHSQLPTMHPAINVRQEGSL